MTASPRPGEEPRDIKSRLADRLLLDELTDQLGRTRSLLTEGPEEVAQRALDRFAGETEVEARIAGELAMTEPLAEPERFPEAHRLAMHALEVLDRWGSRDPKVPRLFFLTPVAEWAVEFVAEYIVQSYAKGVVGRLRSLYARREAQCPPEAPERRLLARARVETDRLAPGFSGGGSLGTILVVGTLALPALASLTNYLGAVDFTDRRIVIAALSVVFVLFLALAGVAMRGAGMARRRSRLIMEQPLAALWETIGHAGRPPEDDSVLFATVAIVLTALIWFVTPLAILGAIYFTG